MSEGKTQSQFSYRNSRKVTYWLNSKLVTLRGGRDQRIYYFTKDEGRAEMTDLPQGYEVNENPRNGFCTIKKVVKA